MNSIKRLQKTYSEHIVYSFFSNQLRDLGEYCETCEADVMPTEIAVASAVFGAHYGVTRCNGNPHELAELHQRFTEITDEISKHLNMSIADREEHKGRK
jgi:hypothetical protein